MADEFVKGAHAPLFFHPIGIGAHDINWNARLEMVSEIKISHIERDFFVGQEEAKAMAEKRQARWCTQEPRQVPLGDAYKSIALLASRGWIAR